MDDPTTGGGRWRLFAGLALLAAVMALSLTIWFVSRDDGASLIAEQTAVPIIRAPEGPDRVRPKDPGGEQVPDQDKQVYETFKPKSVRDEEVVERLLPVSEQPLPDVKPAPTQVVVQKGPAEEQKVEEKTEPKPVTEIVIKPRPKPVPPPKPVATAVTETKQKIAAASGQSAWRVQLAALRDEEAAAMTWNRISAKQKTLLKGLSPSVSKVDTKSKGTFYRLRVGAFGSKAEAEALCGKLKKAGQDCLVAKG